MFKFLFPVTELFNILKFLFPVISMEWTDHHEPLCLAHGCSRHGGSRGRTDRQARRLDVLPERRHDDERSLQGREERCWFEGSERDALQVHQCGRRVSDSMTMVFAERLFPLTLDYFAMYRRYSGPPDELYIVCTLEAISDDALLRLYCVVSHVFPLALIIFLDSTLWKEMSITEKEGGWPVLDTWHSKFFLFYLFIYIYIFLVVGG